MKPIFITYLTFHLEEMSSKIDTLIGLTTGVKKSHVSNESR